MMMRNKKGQKDEPLILAIDTSCDDTAVAITSGWQIKANVVASQVELHRPYGGVFPTVAKLAHRQKIQPCIELALKRAKVGWSDLRAIAVTVGPGLAPALEVGIEAAKDCATAHDLPLIAINHLEAHLWSPLINYGDKVTTGEELIGLLPYPILGMTFSGGHSHFVKINGPRDYEILGESLDDAAGECLDKIGRLLNLGYPAGPVMEKLAAKGGDPQKYNFPLPLTARHDFNLSFSGLKTYARRLVDQVQKENLARDQKNSQLNAQQIADLAASAQKAVFRHILYKLEKLLLAEMKNSTLSESEEKQKSTKKYQNKDFLGQNGTKNGPILGLVSNQQPIFLGGGVAANMTLRREIRQFLRAFNQRYGTNYRLWTPQKKSWCGDNAAMVGAAASLTLERGKQDAASFFQNHPENFDRRPNWPLTEINH